MNKENTNTQQDNIIRDDDIHNTPYPILTYRDIFGDEDPEQELITQDKDKERK